MELGFFNTDVFEMDLYTDEFVTSLLISNCTDVVSYTGDGMIFTLFALLWRLCAFTVDSPLFGITVRVP